MASDASVWTLSASVRPGEVPREEMPEVKPEAVSNGFFALRKSGLPAPKENPEFVSPGLKVDAGVVPKRLPNGEGAGAFRIVSSSFSGEAAVRAILGAAAFSGVSPNLMGDPAVHVWFTGPADVVGAGDSLSVGFGVVGLDPNMPSNLE